MPFTNVQKCYLNEKIGVKHFEKGDMYLQSVIMMFKLVF